MPHIEILDYVIYSVVAGAQSASPSATVVGQDGVYIIDVSRAKATQTSKARTPSLLPSLSSLHPPVLGLERRKCVDEFSLERRRV